jgi:hypothetical protein
MMKTRRKKIPPNEHLLFQLGGTCGFFAEMNVVDDGGGKVPGNGRRAT